MTPYNFALLRYVQSASAQEFVNVGVAMWVPAERRLLFSLNERYARLSRFFDEFDGAGYRQLVRALQSSLDEMRRALADHGEATLGERPAFAAILERVVPEDASCFQWSEVMGGAVTDPEARLAQLVKEFIERHEGAGPRQRRDETGIWARMEALLAERDLLPSLLSGVELAGENYSYRFRVGWRNSVPQVLEPVSFDYLKGAEVVDKANTWSGRLFNLAKRSQFQMTGVVAAPDRRDLLHAYEQALAILRGAPNVRTVVTEEQLSGFIPTIEREVRAGQH